MIGLSPMELVIVGIVAIMLFGQKLPDMMKTFGKSYRDFRNGLSELQSQVNLTDTHVSSSYSNSVKRPPPKTYDDYEEPSAPKFEPPPSEAPSPAENTSATGSH